GKGLARRRPYARLFVCVARSNRRILPAPDQPVFRVDHLTCPLVTAPPQYLARRVLERKRVGDDERDVLQSSFGQFADHGGRDAAALAMRKREVGDLHLGQIARLRLEGTQTNSPNLTFEAFGCPKRAPALVPIRFGNLAQDFRDGSRKFLPRRGQNAEAKPWRRGRKIIGVSRDKLDRRHLNGRTRAIVGPAASGALAGAFLFQSHRPRSVRGQPDALPLDVSDQPEIDVMMMTLVAAFAAIGPGEADPAVLDPIDGSDEYAICADHPHMRLHAHCLLRG